MKYLFLTLIVYFLFSVSYFPSDVVWTLPRALFVCVSVSLCVYMSVPETFTEKYKSSCGNHDCLQEATDSLKGSVKESKCEIYN